MLKKKILITDDEQTIIETVQGILEDEGFDVKSALNGEAALAAIADDLPDLVLLDIWMPGMDGLHVLKKIKDDWPFLPVIIMSGHGNIETAVKATKLGAYDFIEKPLSYEQLVLTIRNALNYKELQEENVLLRQKTDLSRELVGQSQAMQKLKEQIAVVGPTDAWVLIQGENGTGKELVAQTIHRLSKRGRKPLVEVNCAAIPEELIESELFGHEKGAFTGATSMKQGKFDLANGGTLFLDEIGDMSLKTQAKVLRILQEQRFERVGGAKTIQVDVRIIAATNKDLEKEIEAGNFREDLYYRLNVIPIEVPPLRERKEDIHLLLNVFLQEFAQKAAKGHKKVAPDVIEALKRHDWPGNVRELKNLAERLVILSKGSEITLEDLPLSYQKGLKDERASAGSSDYGVRPWLSCDSFRDAKAMFEREYLAQKLAEHGGNITKTAEAIGLERRHLHRKIAQLGLSGE
ncbi:MAG: sigma-54-dependent transcriptional regulator [Dissulfurimicrobium sp.]|uniref:sigma-54-dependent transcriptional regulator n=1 Tax=Dissulfurimicrobium TaxID=1769732 RepID=UPI001EDBBE84|nr:sigma-54 dependent transcriptional regulator [Dissulfurimicrobium hydrothermale]UKL13785.1 sigma-54 dependent transcriptional regulator [Dissulfurimicrobium hydrothermale]